MSDSRILSPSDDLGTRSGAIGLGALIACLDAGEDPFPLRSVRVRASIAGPCMRTEIEQRFANTRDEPVTAIYIFPLPGDGALVDLRIRAGDLDVRGECRERASAEQLFESARRQRQHAALVTEERAGVHTVRLANLPPRAEVTVQLVVVEKVAPVDGCYQWRFPTTIAPRYTPGQPIGHEGPGISPDTDRVPDASRLQPPIRLAGGTQLDLEVAI